MICRMIFAGSFTAGGSNVDEENCPTELKLVREHRYSVDHGEYLAGVTDGFPFAGPRHRRY